MKRLKIFNDARSLLDRRRPSARKSESWYRIENNAGTDTADVYIYDEIGWFGVEASQFVTELNDLSARTIRLHVNSPGGDVFDGVAIMNAIRNHPANVTAEVDGLAASAASFIIQGADHIIMQPGARVMIHDASGVMYGNAEEMRELADLLDKVSGDIALIYSERAGGTVDEWRERMKVTTWYSAQEAVDAGLADEVAESGKRKDPANVVPPRARPGAIAPDFDLGAEIERRARQATDPAPFEVDPAELLAAFDIAANNLPALPVRQQEPESDPIDLDNAILRGVGQ